MFTFPFGQPITNRPPLANRAGLFVLGAYPSALHVRWTAPSGVTIAALAVDNEPEPFWDGAGQDQRIAEWKQAVGFIASWGRVTSARNLNGPSGVWVRDNLLNKFGTDRHGAWITDCLDTYRGSDAQAKALASRFTAFAREAGLPQPSLPPHPSEEDIVNEALHDHRERLVQELRAARPTTIVTLGNAALRVLKELVVLEGVLGSAIGRTADDYGSPTRARIDDHVAVWYPLCHPASPARYQELHQHWRPIAKRE